MFIHVPYCSNIPHGQFYILIYLIHLDTSWYPATKNKKRLVSPLCPMVATDSSTRCPMVPITSRYWTCHPLGYPPGLPNDRWQGRESMCLRGCWLGAWQRLHREDGFFLWHFCQDGGVWRHKSEFRNKDVKWCRCRGPIGLRPSCHIYELSTSILRFYLSVTGGAPMLILRAPTGSVPSTFSSNDAWQLKWGLGDSSTGMLHDVSPQASMERSAFHL